MNIMTPGELSDTAAIRSLIWQETAAFADKDFARWADCYVHDARTTEVYMTDVGVIVHRGWDAVAAAMRQLMADNPEPITFGQSDEDHQISVDRDTAWVIYTSQCHAGGREDRFARGPDHFETRILERQAGRWKIVYAGVAAIRTDNGQAPLIEVEPGGEVIWASRDTLSAVDRFEGLVVSGRRLRAAQRKWDAELQRTIGRAAKLRHLFESTFTTEIGNRFVYPCMLGESDSGGVLHCTVFVRNGTINISFNDDAFVERKIKAATELFGLSAAQRRLLAEVAKGRGLQDAADALNITINTARTHLSRIYEKTGVNSQTALVRLMMSVSSLT